MLHRIVNVFSIIDHINSELLSEYAENHPILLEKKKQVEDHLKYLGGGEYYSDLVSVNQQILKLIPESPHLSIGLSDLLIDAISEEDDENKASELSDLMFKKQGIESNFYYSNSPKFCLSEEFMHLSITFEKPLSHQDLKIDRDPSNADCLQITLKPDSVL